MKETKELQALALAKERNARALAKAPEARASLEDPQTRRDRPGIGTTRGDANALTQI